VSNVLNEEKRQQVIALGRLGWSMRRIEQAAHIRRETVGAYLRAAGIAVRPPGGWGRTPPKPAKEVITDLGPAKPAIHDRYLSRTDGVVLTLLPTEVLFAHALMLLTGRALYALSEAYVYSCSLFSGFEFCIALGQRPSVTSHSFARIQPCERPSRKIEFG
jgi:hypothetical protein